MYNTIQSKVDSLAVRSNFIQKNGQVITAQSHLIQIRVPPKSCFSGSFLQKMASHGQTVHFWLYSVIHRWKALDLSFLMVFLKKYFVNPAKRQNFDDASGQIFSLILRPCHTLIISLKQAISVQDKFSRLLLQQLWWCINFFSRRKVFCCTDHSLTIVCLWNQRTVNHCKIHSVKITGKKLMHQSCCKRNTLNLSCTEIVGLKLSHY